MDSMCPSIACCGSQIRTYDGLAKDLSESLFESRIEVKFFNQRKSVRSLRKVDMPRVDPVQGYTRKPSSFLLVKEVNELGGGCVIVTDNVEKAGSGSFLGRGFVVFVDFHKFGDGAIHTVKVMLSLESVQRRETSTRLMIHHG
jgi:hypothetical protein